MHVHVRGAGSFSGPEAKEGGGGAEPGILGNLSEGRPALGEGPTGDGSRPNALFGKVSSNVMIWSSLSRDDHAYSSSHVSPHLDEPVPTLWSLDCSSLGSPSRGSLPSAAVWVPQPHSCCGLSPLGVVLEGQLHSFMLLSSRVKLVGDLTLFLNQFSKFGATLFHVQKVCLYWGGGGEDL